jgi:hypothetical protein
VAKSKLKLTGAVLEFFQQAGSKGGKRRASKYSAEKLSEWAKLGGRPPGKKKARPKVSWSFKSTPNGEELLLPILQLLKNGLRQSSEDIRKQLWAVFGRGRNHVEQKLKNGKTAFASNVDLSLAYLQGAPHGRPKAVIRDGEKLYRITGRGRAILSRNPLRLTIEDL